MASWRKLHLKVLDSGDFNRLPSDFDRLVWLLLPLCVDREGRGIDDSAWIKSKLFPIRRDVTYKQIEKTMTILARQGMISKYKAENRDLFYILTWEKHQSPHPHEPQSALPAPFLTPNVSTLQLQSSDVVVTMPLLDIDIDIDIDKSRVEESKAETKKQSDHPALSAWREVHEGKYPNKAIWKDMIALVGDDPPNVKRWSATQVAWIGLGWNPTNYVGMKEFFLKGEMPAAKRAAPVASGSNGTGRHMKNYNEVRT